MSDKKNKKKARGDSVRAFFAAHKKDLEEAGKLFSVMNEESERGCVLVGASHIEWRMGEVLRTKFLSQHGEEHCTDNLVTQINTILNPVAEKSILGSAAARARMCSVMGLISEETHSALKSLLVFRNEHFAHARTNAKFSDLSIAKALDKLVKKMPFDFADFFPEPARDCRSKFAYVVICMDIFLRFGLHPEMKTIAYDAMRRMCNEKLE